MSVSEPLTIRRLLAILDANGYNIQFDDATGFIDSNGNELLLFNETASAVNNLEVTNAATGNGPELAAAGDNTNIDLNIAAKGSGEIVAGSDVSLPSATAIHLSNAGNTQTGTMQFGGSGLNISTDAGGIEVSPGGVTKFKFGDSIDAIIYDNINMHFGTGKDASIIYNSATDTTRFFDLGAGSGLALDNAGNIIIGATSTNSHLLEVADGFRTTPVSSPSGTAESGRIYHDSDTDHLKVYANGADRILNRMTPIVIKPRDLKPDTTNPFDDTVVRNQHDLAGFDDTADEIGYFTGVLPNDYQGNGLEVEIVWVAASATSGDVDWLISFEALESQDIDSDSFASANTASATPNGTNGVKTITTISFTDGADMDSVAAGEAFRLQVLRLGSADTMIGDAQILMIQVKGANE